MPQPVGNGRDGRDGEDEEPVPEDQVDLVVEDVHGQDADAVEQLLRARRSVQVQLTPRIN